LFLRGEVFVVLRGFLFGGGRPAGIRVDDGIVSGRGVALRQAVDISVSVLLIVNSFAGEFFLEELAFDDAKPEILGFGFVARPGGVAAGDLDGVFVIESKICIRDDLLGESDALADPGFVDGEDLEGGMLVLHLNLVIESGAVLLGEAIDVFLGEEALGVVERFEVVVEELLGEFVVEGAAAVVVILEHVGDMHAHLTKVGLGRGGERSSEAQGEQENEGEISVAIGQHGKESGEGDR
jgi:hypothetical protein